VKTKSPFYKIIIIAIAFLLWLVSVVIIFRYQIESSLLKGLVLSLTLGISGYFIGWFIKKYTFQELLKTLLPTSATILATIWLLSTGYLDIKAENLKKDISEFEKDTFSLKSEIRKILFQRDSINNLKDNIIEQKDSIWNLYQQLEDKVAIYPQIERENARLKLANKRIPELEQSLKRLNNSTRTYRDIHLKSIRNRDINSNLMIFKVTNQYGKSLTSKEVEIQIFITQDFDKYYPKFKLHHFFGKRWTIPYDVQTKSFKFIIPEELMEIDDSVWAEFYPKVKKYQNNSDDYVNAANMFNGISTMKLVGAEYKILIHN